MTKFPHSRQLRLAPDTLEALDQIARHTCQTRASLMRAYVTRCVAVDAKKCGDQLAKVRAMTQAMARDCEAT
jgi:predicted transcriptional regulator